MHFVYLPGLDGTRALRAQLADRATIVEYPHDRVLAFEDYVAIAREAVRDDSVLIGESFSGPIAIRIAAERPVAGVALVCSFVKAPYPRVFAHVPRFDPAVAFWMVGANRERRRALCDALASVDPRVLRSRLRIALAVDEGENLRRTTMPLLDVRARQDLLMRHPRRAILAERPDAVTAEVDGPHGLLLARVDATWKVISNWWSGELLARPASAG